MDALSIRPARPKDASAISALLHDLAHSAAVEPQEQVLRRLLRNITKDTLRALTAEDNILYLVAFMGKKLAGVIAIRDKTRLIHLFVAPEFQGHGIARRLWQTAGSACIAAGNHEGFTVDSPPRAVPVFEDFGFRPIGSRAKRSGSTPIPMRLTLSHGTLT